MENITTLTALKQQLDRETLNGNLKLTTDNSASQQLTQFLATIPTRQIVLSNVRSTVNDASQTLTMTGSANEDWFIRGTANEFLHIYQISLIYTRISERFEAMLNVEGILTVGQATIVVTGLLEGGNQIRCQIKQPQSVNAIGLVEIANLISHNQLSGYLPTSANLFVGLVPLTALDFSFGFARSTATRFTFTSDLNVSWKIVDKLATLERVGITLTSEHGFRTGSGFRSSIGGNIHANLFIEREYAVSLALQGQYNWEIALIPADGNILPGLAALAGLAGGEALQKSVESGMRTLGLGAVAIDGVYLRVDLKVAALRSIEILGHITVEQITFGIQAYLPNFEFHGRLSPNSPIHLKALISKYFIVTDAFPAIDIPVLNLGAQPKLGKYNLYASIISNWTLKIGDINLIFKEFDLQITKQVDGTTGSIRGILELAGVDLYTSAEYLEIGGGWQFYSSTENNQEIPIGELIGNLAQLFGEITVPTALGELRIQNFYVSFSTQSNDFTFTCESKFPIDGEPVDVTVNINITRQQDGFYNKHFEGHITVYDLQFALIFDTDQTSKTFLGAYHDTTDNEISIKNLIGSISPALKNDIPEGLTISLKDALFAYQKKDTLTNFLFGLDIGNGINLSNLPLVGKTFPPDQTIKLAYQVLVTKADFSQIEITHLNVLYTKGGISLPEKGITNRLDLAASMRLGQETRLLNLPIAINQKSGKLQENSQSTITVPPSADVTSPDGAKWFQLQKTFGPVHFEKIGLNYQDQKIWFLLDAALSTAGLTLSLDGLSVSSPLTKFDPEFNLQGLGIDYKGGPIEIGGAFLKGKITIEGKQYDDYSGTAIIRTKTLTLAAIGSYVQLDEGPSMFVYAVLDYPIGGPAFFFVTGLAAGFGYNRLLHTPPVDQVHTFPLVQEAMGELTGTPNLAAELARLQPFIPPSAGNYFLAIGIRFSSFKMIDSFILVSATFGNRFELDVTGLSTLVLPAADADNAGVTPIAEVQLALRASFIPDDGFFGVNAQLTNNSFLLDRKCHLTGGFAFYSWFAGEHNGDFILTVGGYHPNFSLPSHYPAVPRLGFNWQVSDHLNFKGSAYYALTPSALMAGCNLSATWQDGSLQAWFDAGLDFLISWKPYHYEADFYAGIGASYTFHFFGTHHITAHLSADVSIWGPEFAGKAHISWSIISFTISFGSGDRNQLKPILWSQFRESFLPADDKICTINLKAGLINRQEAKDGNDPGQANRDDLGIVNPITICLTTDSVVPMQRAYLGKNNETDPIPPSQTQQAYAEVTKTFNIGTMQLNNEQIISTQRIIITCDGNPAETEFEFQPLTKTAPAALWGSQLKPSLQGAQLVSNLLTGYEIRAKRPTEASHTAPISYQILQEATTLDREDNAFRWSQPSPFVAQALDDSEVRREIDNTLYKDDIASRRVAIAKTLLGDISLNLNAFKANDLLSPPKVII